MSEDRKIACIAMSTCTDGGGALKLHFKGGHTPEDRKNVLAAINAWNTRPTPSRNDVLEDNDLSEILELLELAEERSWIGIAHRYKTAITKLRALKSRGDHG